MCSFTVGGEYYMMGGSTYDRRFFKILPASKRIFQLPDLSFPFPHGRCIALNDEQALACGASDRHAKECYQFRKATNKWVRVANTIEGHHLGDLAHSNPQQGVVIIGGKDGTGVVELFNALGESWAKFNSFHELIGLTAFTAAGLGESLYVFGGFNMSGSSSRVLKMNSGGQWSVLGQSLVKARNAHRSVKINDHTVIHVGGLDGAQKMEYWLLRESDTFDIKESEFTLANWYGYPETFVVGQYEFDP